MPEPIRSDHDTLIEVKTIVQQLSIQLSQMNSGIHKQLGELDTRIRKIEDLSLIYPAERLVLKYDATAEWVDNLRSRLGVILIVGGGVFTIVTALVAVLVRKWLG